ncbi:MAG: SMP-30/gluconolactonase/LRE family protein [Gemmatimonas sp.]
MMTRGHDVIGGRGAPRVVAVVLALALLCAGCSPSGAPGAALTAQAVPSMLVWPPPPDAPRIRFVATLASPADVGVRRSRIRRLVDAVLGHATARILQPYGVAVDATRRVFVTDTRARGVHVFDPVRKRYAFIDVVGKTAFKTPTGIAVDASGNLYVADSELGVVFSIDPAGRERWRTRQPLARPTGLALNLADSVLYVVETQGHRVVAFDLGGSELFAFGERGDGPGGLNYPTNATVGVDGEVYITDALNFRVQMFGHRGEAVAAFGRHGDAIGDLARPKGIGLDSEGHVYVVDGLYDVVNVYSRAGTLLLSFGGPGRKPGEFWLAAGLTVDAHNRIYVADSYNGRVQVFEYLPAGPGS